MFDLNKKISELNRDYKRLEKNKKEIQLIKLKYAIRENNSIKANK